MVESTAHVSLAQRFWHCLRKDMDGFLGLFDPCNPPRSGLHTYRISLPDGQRRLHLRVDVQGGGVLFVDVTDVIHLNTTAVWIVCMALEGVAPARAYGRLRRHFRHAEPTRLMEELTQVYTMIHRFTAADTTCPTCALPWLPRVPLFSTPTHAPYKVDIALTYGCNNQCAHCYNTSDRFDMPSLPITHWYRILDKLATIGVPHVIFTGGEATLHPGLPALVAYAEQLGMIVGLNTNGRRLAHRPFVQTLADAGLNHVQVTLGSSCPAIHNRIMHADSFDQTVLGIRNALDSSLHTITNTTLMRCNMDHVEEIVALLHDLGIRTFAMNGMIHAGGGSADPVAIPPEELAPLLIRVRDYAATLGMHFLWYTPTQYCRLSPVELELGARRCNAAEYSMCVEPNGDVLPCQSYYVRGGNLLHDNWEDIWNSELFRSFRERTRDPHAARLPEKCQDCPDLPWCGGGCRLEYETGEEQSVEHKPQSKALPLYADRGGFIPVSGLAKSTVRARGTQRL